MTEKEKKVAMTIRNVPESVRRTLKSRAALKGKSLQGLILELIMQYVAYEE
ncbi:MAG: hypothetical protein U9Q89_06010 [Thermodesulfobacteriota bacterium]|nr:hypothetical protein [Thermodesulfobacteriota bacterium]